MWKTICPRKNWWKASTCLFEACCEVREIASPGPFKSEVKDRDSRSVHEHCQGSGSDSWHRVDKETVAIAGDGVLDSYGTRRDDARLEKSVGNACHRLVMRRVDRYRHKLFVYGDIEKFFSIRTPARLRAAMIGYLDAPAWARETAYIHIRILSSSGRRRSGEGDPFPIGRKLGFRTRCVGCLRMVTEVKSVQFRRTAMNMHIDEKAPVRRPVVGNQKIGRGESLQLARTIGSRNVDVLRSPVKISYICHPFAVRRENRKYFCPSI